VQRPKRRPAQRFAIVTTGRTGSVLLAERLDSHPDIACEGEILGDRRHFPVQFAARRGTRAALGGAQAYGFTINCRHFGYQILREEPGYLRRLATSGYHLIFLRRRNVVAQALSAAIASRTRWHWVAGDRPVFAPFEVDPVEVLTMSYLFEESDQLLVNALQGLPHLTVTYEDDLQEPDAQQATVDRICSLLHLAGAPTWSDQVRYTPRRQADTASNFEAVADLLEPTRFRRFLDDEAATFDPMSADGGRS
jgi:hypothetical protein